MTSRARESSDRHDDWHLALLPCLTLLGIALPATFLAQVEPYLFYLRPIELLPAFATAWLAIAALVLPCCAVAYATLRLTRALGATRVKRALGRGIVWVALTSTALAVLYCLLIWIRSFGLLSDVRVTRPLIAVAVTLGVSGAALIPDGWLRRARSLQGLTALGACSVVCLPFFAWGSGEPGRLSAVGPPTSQRPPHILLVTLDALTASRMSLYGAPRPTTPYLERFATEATVFERMYANANFTTAGISSLLTGTRPWTHRAFEVQTWPVRAARAASLPALLAAAGYKTGYITSNPYAGATKNGFGRYFSWRASDTAPISLPCPDEIAFYLRYECAAEEEPILLAARNVWSMLQERLYGAWGNDHYDPGRSLRPALAWLSRTNTSNPIFLWVHLLPPHAPYAAPRPWLGTFDRSPFAMHTSDSTPDQGYWFAGTPALQAQVFEARYEESIAYVDHYLGTFIPDALRLLGPNTAIVITADHGESFEHGYGGHGGPALYDSIIHVPLLIRFPFQTAPVRCSGPVEQVDIAPTLATLAGITKAGSPLWEGRSLISSPGAAARCPEGSPSPIYSMSFEESRRFGRLTTGSVAVIAGNWKLVRYLGRLHYAAMPSLSDALYDLGNDPAERHNLIVREPRKAMELAKLIDLQLAVHGGPLS